MSVMTISMESFANVKRTLSYLTILRGWNNVKVYEDLTGVRRPSSSETSEKEDMEVEVFIQRGYFFNNLAYALRYNEEDGENFPIPQFHGGEILPLPQLFQTLKSLQYNSDMEDYVEKSEIRSHAWGADYVKYKMQIKRLINDVAYVIATNVAEEQHCTWG